MDNNQNSLPPIVRQVSKQHKNKLAKRLYKNSSMNKLTNTAEFSYLKNINPDSSILATSLTRNNSSKNMLIPSVSLKRYNANDSCQRSLQITQGKILVTKSQEPSFLHYKGDLKFQMKKTSAHHKTLFKKMPRFDSPNQSKIVPDELLGCSSDQQGPMNESKLVQRLNVSPKSQQNKMLRGLKSKQKKFFEEDETLTPNDFIQLAQEDGSITNEFCYLKKMSHPYDLRIVQFQSPTSSSHLLERTMKPAIPPTSEYITISSRGVSYFNEQNSRFVPLDRWKKQAYYFSKLMKLGFFVNFRQMKSFAKWKKHIRKTAMKSTSQKLRSELMMGDKYLRRALLVVKDQCYRMQSDINYCKLQDTVSVMQFQAFKQAQQQFIQNQFQRRIILAQQQIKSSLIENMSSSMKQFKQQNKISTTSEGKGIPLLIGDEKNLDMPYTKEATLRTQQEKFKKFLKMVEFIIVDSKIKMMKQSTDKIVGKIEQENDSYQKQVIETEYKLLFKGKQYIRCSVKLSLSQQSILLKPTKQQLNFMFQQIVNKAIVKLCRNHKKISNDQQILQIIYDSHEKIIKQPQTNMLKVIIMSDDRQEKIVSVINNAINRSYGYLEMYCGKFMNLVEIYFANLDKLHTIQTYQAKDHQLIAQSLDKWKTQLLQISMLYQQHQSAIFLLDFQEFKINAMRCVSQCLDKMKRVLPEIFYSSTDSLLNELDSCQEKIRLKPNDIEGFIEFQKNKAQITVKMDDFSDRLAEINCINLIIKGYSAGSDLTNLSRQQREINKLQSRLSNLRTKLEQAQMNTKSYENRAQQLLKAKIPLINQSITQLYLTIKNQKFSLHSDTQQVAQALNQYKKMHQQIAEDIKKLKWFQMQLSVQQFNEQTFNKFTGYFNNYQHIWKLHQQMTVYQNQILKSPWMTVNIEKAQKSVDHFINHANRLKKVVTSQSTDDQEFKIQPNDIDVISYVYSEAKDLKPLIETVQCLRDKSLGEKEWKEIKSYFEKINKDSVCKIIDIDNKTATLHDIQQEKVIEQLDFIQSVVLRSKKQLQIHNKMTMVNKFWIESSANNTGKNLAQNFEKYYWDIIAEVDEKITVINGITEDPTQVQAQQLRQNIIQNKQMFETLRMLLVEWQTHQKHLRYLEPIFMNPYWKSNPKELKLYNQAQMNWKKILKQCKDYSLKRWASNEKAIATIKQNNLLFEELKKSIDDFLSVKRDIFPKFYFLSNQELLQVLLTQRQAKNIEENLGKVFTCVKSLECRQLGQILVSTNFESIQTKFAKAFNALEVQQIFKMLQQGIKTSVRSNMRNCMSNFQKDEFIKKKWVKDHLLQSLLFIQKSQYTKIIEYDYMGPEAEDLSQYIIYQNNQVKQLHTYIKDHNGEQGLSPKKIETLILQQILHRDVTQMLLTNRITDEQSYEWQKHIRCYYSIENAVTKFFVNQIQYGYQLVNLHDAYPYVSMSDREVIDLAMALKLKHVPVIKGRESLVYRFAKFNAKYYKNVLCESRVSQKYMLGVCFGTYLSGAYTQFQQAQTLTAGQISFIGNFLKQIYSSINRRDRSFNFGWKKNFINFNSGIVFHLSDTANTYEFEQRLILPARAFEFKSVPYQLYVDLILQARRYSSEDLSRKVTKTIQVINELQEYQVFHFHNIRAMLSMQNTKSVENYEQYLIKQLQTFIAENIASPKKVSFYKRILHSIFYGEKNANDTLISQPNLLKEKTSKQKTDFKSIVSSLLQIVQRKHLCIIAGSTQSGKMSLIGEAYKQRMGRVQSQMDIFNLDILSTQALFGCFIDGLWCEGVLTHRVRQLSPQKQEWIVFEGEYSSRIQQLVTRLRHPHIQLPNGSALNLSNTWKFIFSIVDMDQNSPLLSKNISILNSTKFITIEQSMYLMMEKRIRRHFSNADNYKQLSNMCINKVEKVLDLVKTVGYKNEFLRPQNILRYFVNILDALLTAISTQIKASKQFSKGIEKIFIWAIYWCAGSGMPEPSANKYEKSIFQAIKTDIDRSQSLSQIRLDFETPAGTLKKIKNNELNLINGELYFQSLDLKSKASFVELMINADCPIILTGKSGSGKSKFMQYLQKYLNSDQYTYLTVKLRKQMTFCQFRDILQKKTRISIKSSKKKCFSSSTSKRLIIFIDDFNLLDFGSQIGQFLVTCIKNNYYYDNTTFQIIYLQNISFVVAENDTYENRMGNRFLKYFKPIFINEIQLKDIAEIYKQQFPALQHSREIFDSTVSLHNFVMNLQQGSQIRKQVPFSHKNSVRIMKTLAEYKPEDELKQQSKIEGQRRRQDMAKIWAYISKEQYSSYGISKQIQQLISKQILNLVNLVIQNSGEKPKPVPYLNEFLAQLQTQHPFVKTDADFQEYYQFLAFTISLSKPHNLLTINEPLPEFIKKEILHYAANTHSLKFSYVKKLDVLKSMTEFKYTLIYLSSQSFSELANMISFILNNQECKMGRFVIDCQDQSDFTKLIKVIPSVFQSFHIFTKKESSESRKLITSEYKEWIDKLQAFLSRNLTHRQTLAIISNMLKKQGFFKDEIQRKKKLASRFISRYLKLQQQVQKHSKQIEQLSESIKGLHFHEQQLFEKKRQSSEKIVLLKNAKSEDEQQQEERKISIRRLQDQNQETQNELKILKTKKKDLSEKVSNLETVNNLKKQVYKKLAAMYESFIETKAELQQVHKVENEIIFCLSLYYFGVKNKVRQYVQFIEDRVGREEFDMDKALRVIFQINPTSITREIVVWLMEGKAVVVRDRNGRFEREVKRAVPKMKVFDEIRNLANQYEHMAHPVLYTGKFDPLLLKVEKCTLIVKQLTQEITENFANRTVITMQDALQNQKESIRAYLYSHKQRQLDGQIRDLEEEIYRFKVTSWENAQRIVEEFLDPKAKDLKHLKSMLYFPNDRAKMLYQGLAKAQGELHLKYDEVIEMGALFKSYLQMIGKKFRYFFYNEEKFLQLFLNCIVVKPAGQVTRKRLFEMAGNSKKSFKTLKSKKQLVTLKHLSKKNIPAQSNISELVAKPQANNSMSALKQIDDDQANKDNSIETFRTLMVDEVLRNLSLGLKGSDFLQAYTMLACLLVQREFGVSGCLMENMVRIINGETLQVDELEKLADEVEVKIKAMTTMSSSEGQLRLRQICKRLTPLITPLSSDHPSSLLQLIISFSDISLNKSFDDLLNQKYQINSLEQKQNIVLVSNPAENPFEMVQKYILSNIEDCYWCYVLPNQITCERIIQVHEKYSVNWIVIINQVDPLILDAIKQAKIQKTINLVFLFTEEWKFMNWKQSIIQQNKSRNLEQLLLIYADEPTFIYKKISNVYLNCFTKLLSEESFEIQQISRVVFYEQANQLLKEIYQSKNLIRMGQNETKRIWLEFYQTRAIIEVALNLRTIDIKNFIKIMNNLCFAGQKDKQNVVLKQGKKIVSKNEDLLQTFLQFFMNQFINDESHFEGSPFVMQSGSTLTESFSFITAQQIVNLLIPGQFKKKYPVDSLYFFTLNTTQFKEQQQILPVIELNQQQLKNSIDKVQNQLPSIVGLESQSQKKQKLYYKQILRHEVKKRVNAIKRVVQMLKKYKRVVAANKIFSPTTETQLLNIVSYLIPITQQSSQHHLTEVLTSYLSQQQKSIQYLQNLYLSKDMNKIFQPSYFKDPLRFLKCYLYQMNTHVNFLEGEIHARYLTQKQRETHLDEKHHTPSKSLILTEVVVKNGKFDPIKSTIQTNDKNETSKIPNVQITFIDKEFPNLTSVVPIQFQNNTLSNLLVINKVKDDSIWKEKLSLEVSIHRSQ